MRGAAGASSARDPVKPRNRAKWQMECPREITFPILAGKISIRTPPQQTGSSGGGKGRGRGRSVWITASKSEYSVRKAYAGDRRCRKHRLRTCTYAQGEGVLGATACCVRGWGAVFSEKSTPHRGQTNWQIQNVGVSRPGERKKSERGNKILSHKATPVEGKIHTLSGVKSELA